MQGEEQGCTWLSTKDVRWIQAQVFRHTMFSVSDVLASVCQCVCVCYGTGVLFSKRSFSVCVCVLS